MRVALGDVCTPRSSVVDPTLPHHRDLPHVAPDSIERDSGRLLSVRSAAEDRVTSGKYRFRPGDVLYSKIRPNLNKVALVDFAGLCSADMYALDVDRSRATAGFLAHLLRSSQFLGYATALSSRANIPKLNRGQLATFEFELPTIDRQRYIAAVLDRADTLRTKRRAVLACFPLLTDEVFDAMFGDPIAGAGRSTVADAADVQIGPFGSLLHREDYVADGVPLVNPMHIVDGTIRPDPEFSVTAEKAATLSTYRLHAGDVVLGRRGEMGRCAVAGVVHEGFVCGTGSLIVRPRDGVVPTYLQAALAHPRTRRALQDRALGATLPNLNASIVTRLPLLLPPRGRQQEFASRMQRLGRQRAAVQSALAVDDELFSSLQARAFDGRL